ncbi:ALF repeat-containing protein [Streptomyces sp. NPDC048257]|uniref:ALF repeat-containing protein n=1 Tax=Streptomyces sp. NPDC048257 TaxID=3365526 RepID=UPI0037102979
MAAGVAAVSTPLLLTTPVRAAPGAAAPAGDALILSDTDRAKVVKAWILGGRSVRQAAACALGGTDQEIRTFPTEQSLKDTRTRRTSQPLMPRPRRTRPRTPPPPPRAPPARPTTPPTAPSTRPAAP